MTAVDRAGMIARRADLIDEIFRIQGRIAQIDEWLAATPQGGVLDLTTKPPWRRAPQASTDAQAAQAAQAAPSHAWATRFAQAASARPGPEVAPAMNGFAEIMADFEAAAAAVDAAVEEPAAAPPPRQRKRRQKRPEGSPRKYSAPSQEALELLERAGDAGLTVKQLADQMRTPIGTAGGRLSTLKAFGAARHKKPRYFIRRDGDDVA